VPGGRISVRGRDHGQAAGGGPAGGGCGSASAGRTAGGGCGSASAGQAAERSCRASGGRRQGEEWKSDADAQVFFPPGRLGDALKTLVGSTN